MTEDMLSRTRLLLGEPAIETLKRSHVAVFGVGGVGGYTTEALARSGIGELTIVDNDRVCVSNLNRQIYALQSTIGQYKVDVSEQRIHDINPECVVHKYQMFYMPDNADQIDLTPFDYVVDCIDTVTAKIELIRRCHALDIPLICSMGAANKMDPTAFRVTDITKTAMDPLAKIIRKKLRLLHIAHQKVIYSEEPPMKPIKNLDKIGDFCTSQDENTNPPKRRSTPASNAFVPATAGLIAAGEVVKDLLIKAGTMRE